MTMSSDYYAIWSKTSTSTYADDVSCVENEKGDEDDHESSRSERSFS